MESENKQTNLVQSTLLENIKPVASQNVTLTLDEFHMKAAKIVKVEVQEQTKGYVDGKFVDPLPVPQYQLFVESEPLKTVKDAEGKDIIFTAKEWFNLVKLKDGGFGWTTHEKGKLNNFLKAVKCTNLKELIGKPIIVKVVDKDQKDGTKIQLLRFMY